MPNYLSEILGVAHDLVKENPALLHGFATYPLPDGSMKVRFEFQDRTGRVVSECVVSYMELKHFRGTSWDLVRAILEAAVRDLRTEVQKTRPKSLQWREKHGEEAPG